MCNIIEDAVINNPIQESIIVRKNVTIKAASHSRFFMQGYQSSAK